MTGARARASPSGLAARRNLGRWASARSCCGSSSVEHRRACTPGDPRGIAIVGVVNLRVAPGSMLPFASSAGLRSRARRAVRRTLVDVPAGDLLHRCAPSVARTCGSEASRVSSRATCSSLQRFCFGSIPSHHTGSGAGRGWWTCSLAPDRGGVLVLVGRTGASGGRRGRALPPSFSLAEDRRPSPSSAFALRFIPAATLTFLSTVPAGSR